MGAAVGVCGCVCPKRTHTRVNIHHKQRTGPDATASVRVSLKARAVTLGTRFCGHGHAASTLAGQSCCLKLTT